MAYPLEAPVSWRGGFMFQFSRVWGHSDGYPGGTVLAQWVAAGHIPQIPLYPALGGFRVLGLPLPRVGVV